VRKEAYRLSESVANNEGVASQQRQQPAGDEFEQLL